MVREVLPGRPWGAIALALLVAVPSSVAILPGDGALHEPALDDAPPKDLDLEAPLLQLATASDERQAIHTAHDAGQSWARGQLADEPSLAGAIETLYVALGLEPHGDEAQPVPAAFQAPLATLVTLQAHHAAATGPYSLAHGSADALTLGALEPVLAALEEARQDAPEDPILVDPLGLVVLGGSGDDTYTPQTVAVTEWKGPILVVEPAGNETYHIPVAAPLVLDRPQAPIDPLEDDFQYGSIALELGGNDTYHDRTASADLGAATQAILLDRSGDDRYGDTDIERTTAHASSGFAYLLDERGDDRYRTHSEGIAYAHRTSTAVLWDQRGNDTYLAHHTDGRYTHAMAHSRDAGALLWDEEGDDTYRTELWAFGSSWNDAHARFLDEEGDDQYSSFIPNSSFGFHNEELSAFVGDSVLGFGLGEFIDRDGEDRYTWDTLGSGKNHTPSNGDQHVDHRPDRRYGVFIDCTTPADADRPCPEEQDEARCTMLANPGGPAEARGLIEPLLDPTEGACRSLGP